MNTVQKIAKNSLVLLASNIISKILGFFYVMYIVRYLGAEGFGILSFTLAFAGIFGVFNDLGLNLLTVREVTRDKSFAGKYLDNICVVHLIRAKNGIEPFMRFLESYSKNCGGIEHELLIIFKGFYREKELEEYRKLLEGYSYHSFFVEDVGYDIGTYLEVAKKFGYKYFCFLNSFSIILDNAWLIKMYRYICQEDIGLVGATGSYESLYSNELNTWSKKNKNQPFYKSIKHRLSLRKYKLYFDPFPNFHIRSNGFMISGELMRKIRYLPIVNKIDAHRFESGKNSLTKQILEMKLKALIVGKDGNGYEKEIWYNSKTFRQGDQENLLIADNRTNQYLYADNKTKLYLSRCAWGDKANP